MTNIKKALSKRLAIGGLSIAAALSGGYLVAPWEGNRTTAYVDPVGIHTACWGKTGTDLYGRTIRAGMKYTQEECDTMLLEELKKVEGYVDSVVNVPYASVYQQAALISFTYNVGLGNLRSSTLLKQLNSGNHQGACEQLTRWVYAGGVKLRGLESRRGEEMGWCLGNVSQDVKFTTGEIILDMAKATFDKTFEELSNGSTKK